jgi:hypothetical protein
MIGSQGCTDLMYAKDISLGVDVSFSAIASLSRVGLDIPEESSKSREDDGVELGDGIALVSY